MEVFKLDHGTCNANVCYGEEHEGMKRQFFPTSEIHWEEPVINGYYHGQISHLHKRDYEGLDPYVFNEDGTRRVEFRCSVDHALYEVEKFCSYRQAFLILTGQTFRTYDWIAEHEMEDQDIPLDIKIFTPREIVDINNIRREKLKTTIRRASGLILAEQSVFYSIREMV